MSFQNVHALLSRLPDQTAGFLSDGYLFQERLRRARGRDASDARPLAARLLGRPALLVRGKEGVELFYDTSRMKREKAMPLPVRGPLFGKGAVHGLDDEAHRHRKAMFVRIAYDDAQVERIKPFFEREMRNTLARWEEKPGTVYDGSVITYGRAALRWAGVPGDDAEIDVWAQRLGQIVEGFGRKSPAHVEAWVNRRRGGVARQLARKPERRRVRAGGAAHVAVRADVAGVRAGFVRVGRAEDSRRAAGAHRRAGHEQRPARVGRAAGVPPGAFRRR